MRQKADITVYSVHNSKWLSFKEAATEKSKGYGKIIWNGESKQFLFRTGSSWSEFLIIQIISRLIANLRLQSKYYSFTRSSTFASLRFRS